ncbi:hypothetical protein A2W14_01640 [Candidatus Gottesmanbacteria bacterium RBG_16_37_8]|uniref:Glycosyl transferase family 1 n=1 Tax=Candidatus Gottesmanbacteria bacterium RBG_16_37_8 TaxID=1798371 RepID=A0A1F5YQX2_9BACT|nr:MAG: hypothetical protein A2W14_01640 [Candidatus Gottesmanbacteria bacterium RBG_16_37_8]
MRIAQISYWSCPLTRLGVLTAGGMNVYLFNLAKSLTEKGHRVDIFVRSHSTEHDSVLDLGSSVSLIHLNSVKYENLLGPQYFAKAILKYVKDKKLEYNLLHAHYYLSGLTGLWLKNKLKIPLIQTFHTLGAMKKKYIAIDDQKRIQAEKKIIDNCDVLVSSTQLEKKDLVDYYKANPEKISVINPGVDHQLFAPGGKNYSREKLKLPLDKKIILFVGRIDPVKGLNLLLEAIFRITEIDPQFKNNYQVLLIGGDIESRNYWQNKNIKDIINFLKVKDLECCIKFLGSRSHSDLPYFYSAADLVVLPSVYESFGLVILEAMACGAAVLASKVGGLKYLIKDNINGSLFKSGDIRQLSDKIVTLLKDNPKRQELGLSAYRDSLFYSWEKHADKLLTLYKNFA